MTTAEKALREVNKLKKEVSLLRSFVMGKKFRGDEEGEYKPEFIRDTLKAAKERPLYKYTGPGSLLKMLKKFEKKR